MRAAFIPGGSDLTPRPPLRVGEGEKDHDRRRIRVAAPR